MHMEVSSWPQLVPIRWCFWCAGAWGYCLYVFPWPLLVFSCVVACMSDCVGPVPVPEVGPIRPKHVLKGNMWYIYATNCVDGNCNKELKSKVGCERRPRNARIQLTETMSTKANKSSFEEYYLPGYNAV
jgi:hypothetical protein